MEGAGGFVEVVLGDFVLPSFINNLPKVWPPRRLALLLFITLGAFVEGAGGFVEVVVLGDFVLPSFIKNLGA